METRRGGVPGMDQSGWVNGQRSGAEPSRRRRRASSTQVLNRCHADIKFMQKQSEAVFMVEWDRRTDLAGC